jgi:hypothetical protein
MKLPLGDEWRESECGLSTLLNLGFKQCKKIFKLFSHSSKVNQSLTVKAISNI